MKICTKCKLTKKESDFYRNPKSLCFDSWCRRCKNTCPRSQSITARREQKLQRKYRISILEFNESFSKQGGVCAICETSTGPFCIDHCHRLGMVRGILCRKCNVGLGMLQDSASLVLKAHEYLKKYLTN